MDVSFMYLKKRQKTKELRVLQVLKGTYREPTEYNVRVSSECGGKNAEEKEFGYDFGTHKVFFEVDENRHTSYCELGEINRMKNIYMNEGGVPILFMRYNPDGFTDGEKRQTIPQAERERLFIKWLKFYENVDNIKHDLSVHYLFYNDHTRMGNTNYEIDPYVQYENHNEQANKTFYIPAYEERFMASMV
jgi:hypothetical protein